MLAVVCAFLAFGLSACASKNYLDPSTIFSEGSGLTFSGKSVSFSEKHETRLFENGTAENGFTVSYTVEGDRKDYLWVNSGGLYVEQEDGTWHNIIIFHNPWRSSVNIDAYAQIWIIQGTTDPEDEEGNSFAQDSTGANFMTTLPFSVSSNPMGVEIAYYRGAYYIRLEKTYSVKLDAESNIADTVRIDVDKLFAEGTRKIGFRTAETPATFSKINYELGDEAALKAIKSMKLAV